MALVEAEDLVYRVLGPGLEGDHGAGSWRQAFAVGRVLQLAIPLVARALARVLAAVQAIAERLPLRLRQIQPDIVVVDFVGLDVLESHGKSKWS